MHITAAQCYSLKPAQYTCTSVFGTESVVGEVYRRLGLSLIHDDVCANWQWNQVRSLGLQSDWATGPKIPTTLSAYPDNIAVRNLFPESSTFTKRVLPSLRWRTFSSFGFLWSSWKLNPLNCPRCDWGREDNSRTKKWKREERWGKGVIERL